MIDFSDWELRAVGIVGVGGGGEMKKETGFVIRREKFCCSSLKITV